MTATINSSGFAEVAGSVIIYNYDTDGLFTGQSVEELPVGVGIPALSTLREPPAAKDGFVVQWLDGWAYTEDHRGEVVYNTMTRSPLTIEAIGEYPEGMTTLAPGSPYDEWVDGAWVLNEQLKAESELGAIKSQQETLLAEANAIILPWQTDLLLGMISDEDKASLQTWVTYIKTLKALVLSTDVVWPVKPN